MKKVLFVAVIALASVMAYAQPRAIGARFGGFEGVSYQHSLGEDNMIEIELGYGMGGFVNGGNTVKYSAVEEFYPDQQWAWTLTGNGVIEAAFTYDWINPLGKTIPWDKKGKWNWYLGVGAAGGYGWKDKIKITDLVDGNRVYEGWSVYAPTKSTIWNSGDYYVQNWGYIGAAGRVGVEYEFWFPLVISADFRPTLGVGLAENPAYVGYQKDGYREADIKKVFGSKVMAGFYWDVFNVAISARYKF